MVNPSPWPLIGGLSALMLTLGAVLYMHGFLGGRLLGILGLVMVLLVMYCWWRDIVREGTFEGQHTKQVQKGLRAGVILFIVSELMFFCRFLLGFFSF